MIGKVVRTVLKVFGWLNIGMALLGLAVSLGEGIQKDDIGFILFFLIVGAGILLLVRQAEKKVETQEVKEATAVNISAEQINELLAKATNTGSGEMRQMICDGCGASIKVGPGIAECEYCGSHLSQG